jgi:hypothetical protein
LPIGWRRKPGYTSASYSMLQRATLKLLRRIINQTKPTKTPSSQETKLD